MKSKKLAISFSLIVVMALAFGFVLPSVLGNVSTDVAYAAAGNYYSSITATSGTALLGQLHDLIVSTHTKYTSYADCKSYATQTDPGSASGTVMELYTQIDISVSNFDNSGGWNREHVWAQSLSNGTWGTNGAGSDLHHIRPAEKDINNHRGNKLYGEVSGGTAEYTSVSKVLGGHSNSSTFEPLDNVKGDIARIIMYVYTHYNNKSNVGGTIESNGNGNLPIRKIITASSDAAAWQLLLKWNKLDPVDEIERNRNEAVYNIQHNRNPFIDNESYADAIWGGGSVEKVDLLGLAITPNSLSLAQGSTKTLSVQPNPSNANAQVTWSSSNTSVATVNNGVVTAVSAGSATITATSVENSSIKATATVTVTAGAATSDSVQAFVDKVNAVETDANLQKQFDAIKAALQAYNNLTADEKTDLNAQYAYQTLQLAIENYNDDVNERNEKLQGATQTGAYAICAASLAGAAFVIVLKRKFF